MQQTARRLFGDIEWSVLPAGRAQMRLGAVALAMGGNVRVGLEDNLYIGPGELAVSNAQQVEKIGRLAAELDRALATPAEARTRLGIGASGFP
jgi:uncharacterized protein (DUF849 family)